MRCAARGEGLGADTGALRGEDGWALRPVPYGTTVARVAVLLEVLDRAVAAGLWLARGPARIRAR
jgi:hypothetical protein